MNNILSLPLVITFTLALITFGCGGGGGGSSSSGSGKAGVVTVPKGVTDLSGSSDPVTGSSDFVTATSSSVTLSWIAPAANSDGSQLSDLAGYKVYYGNASSNYTYSVDVGNTTGAAISSLSVDTWCFAVTAYDTAGNESDYSDEACI